MKTIITTLPIYNKIEKQCFERGRHAGHNTPTPIVCPRHRLPSFQWLDQSDGAGSISKIELCDITAGAEETIATDWISHVGFDTFTHSGLEIDPAINAAGVCTAYCTLFDTVKGTQIRVIGTLVLDSAGGTEPTAFLSGAGAGTQILAAGANNFILKATTTLSTNAVTLYNAAATEYHFTGVSIKKITGALDITDYFSTLPGLGHDYFTYDGDTLKYLLDTGVYYLKITTDNGYVYYSDWFEVDCVYENLLTDPDAAGHSYDTTLTTSGTAITAAVQTAASAAYVWSNYISINKGETYRVITYLTSNSGERPSVTIDNVGVGSVSNTVQLAAGINVIDLVATSTIENVRLRFGNSTSANWATTEILLIKTYSDKYLIINFHNDCDLGDFYYHGGFDQTIWFESEPMETTFPQEEEALKNGEGRIIKIFIRQDKKYTARTGEMPDYMVDVYNRMKLHDFIELIDLVGDTHTVYNLEVAHEWLYDDKYYAKIDLTFDYDEAVVVGGCCNNI